MKRLLIIIAAAMWCAQAGALPTVIDSLKTELKGAEGRKKAEILNSLAEHCLEPEPEKARDYAESALEISRERHDRPGEAWAISTLGKYSLEKGDLVTAGVRQREALTLSRGNVSLRVTGLAYARLAEVQEELGDIREAARYLRMARPVFTRVGDRTSLAYTVNYIGYLYWVSSEYDSALVFFTEALELREKLGDRYTIAKTSNNMGSVYFQQGEYEKALGHFFHALKTLEGVEDRELLKSFILGNIGKTYKELGKPEEAIRYLRQALGAGERFGDRAAIGYALNTIGAVFEAGGGYDSSFVYYQRSFSSYQADNDLGGVAMSLNGMGRVSHLAGRYAEALAYAEKAYMVASGLDSPDHQAAALTIMGLTFASRKQYNDALEKLRESRALRIRTGQRDLLKENYEQTSRVCAASGDYRSALDYYRRFTALKDSLFTEKTVRAADRMRIMYESERKDHENELLRKKNEAQTAIMQRNRLTLLLITISLGAILFSSLLLLWSNRGKERANALLQARNEEILRQRDEIARLAVFDELTGLLNRRMFHRELSAEFNKAKRYCRTLSCIMIDIDHFKRVNDTYGHDSGDAALREIAALIRDNCRATDVVARYGGEEIVVLLPETKAEGAYAVAEKIRRTAREHTLTSGDGARFSVTLSLGIVTVGEQGILMVDNPEKLVKFADIALYQAKAGGRDTTRTYAFNPA